MKEKLFEGSCVALVTPMLPSGEIDEDALIRLVEWHIQEGTNAIVVAGSTGESATLTQAEVHQAVKLVQKVAKGKLPIIAGTGTNATASTILQTQNAKALGVDACLIVTPYYNRPTQQGLIEHYRAIARAVDIPILLYNVPSRTACDMQPETVVQLSAVKQIIGVKEATGDLQRVETLREQCEPGFMLYSGDDPSALAFMLRGGHGDISITANVAPNLMQKMCRYALVKEEKAAMAVDEILQPLHQLMGVQANPIPVKWALHFMGKISNGIRLPLMPLTLEYHDKMKQALQAVM
ncbi:MAG: 4-hydroxy-tetrahydrodipicolinate synthase [Proteobacteria bacterium]|nr:4-hydroxy-tetrahydrodipicolinate synthase [Pseudomonadota bacterium]